MKGKSNWDYYAVKIIKHIIVDGEPDPNLIDEYYDDDDRQLFEESVVLVHAQSYGHAQKIAEKKAVGDESSGPNKYGQQVCWKFIKAVDCFLILDELKSGAEIYTCFHTASKDETADEFLEKWFSGSEDSL